MKCAGMELGKWVSNSSRVADRSLATTEVQGKGSNSTAKVLGIYWDPEEDMLSYKNLTQRVSSWTKLVRVVAYTLRFIQKTKAIKSVTLANGKMLTVEEIYPFSTQAVITLYHLY